IERDVIGNVYFRFGVENCGREKTKIAGGPRNVQRARERGWFAGIDRLGASELLQITLNKIGNAQENARPVRYGVPRPFYKRFLCRSHGGINIARIAVRHLRIWLSGCGLDVVEVLTTDGLNELTVDEVSNFVQFGVHGMLHPPEPRPRFSEASTPNW